MGKKILIGLAVLIGIVVVIAVAALVYLKYFVPEPAPEVLPQSDYDITAQKLAEVYKENEENADKVYQGKVVTITGIVEKLDTEDLRGMNILFKLENLPAVLKIRAFFDYRVTPEQIQLAEGAEAKIKCRCKGKLGEINLADCVPPDWEVKQEEGEELPQ